MAQLILKEIGHTPGPDCEFAENRESYSLAAGIALGMITLGVSNKIKAVQRKGEGHYTTRPHVPPYDVYVVRGRRLTDLVYIM